MTVRDYDKECLANEERQYAYDFDRRMQRFLLRTVAPYLRGGSVLELGCYNGNSTEVLLDYFPHVHVVEGAKVSAERCALRFGSQVTVTSSLFTDYVPEQAFHNVFLVHTLEHLDEPIQQLRHIGEHHLKHGSGRLFVACPNANAPSRQIAVAMGLIDHPQAVTQGEALHGHRVTYTLDTLCADLKKAGFRLLQFGGVFFKPLANFQLDKALEHELISEAFLEGCFELGKKYPDLCSSIYAVAEYGEPD